MPPREQYRLADGVRPYVGAYTIVREGPHYGIGGRIKRLSRSKFAPATATAEDLSARVAMIETDASTVIHVRADHIDVYELVGRYRNTRYTRRGR